MAQNQHFRKREGDIVNACLCTVCFTQKCCAYEITISELNNEYGLFKAYVEHRRGNVDIAHILLQEDHYGVFTDYALHEINDGAPAHDDWNVVKELQKYLVANNFKFIDLDTFELQRIMK